MAKDDSEKVAQIKEWEAATVKEIQDKAHKESAEANQRAAEDLKRQARVMLEESDSILDGVRLGFMLSEESAVSTARSIADVMGDSMRTTKDHITDMVQSGKFEFEDLFNYVERRAIDLMISQPATNALMSGMSMMFSGIGGFAYGGVSHGPQLAWVSEGPYDTEAHVPMPDGRTIPVTITQGAQSRVVVEQSVNVNNTVSDSVEVSTRTNENGELDITISKISQSIMEGDEIAGAISSRFNVTERF